MLDISRKAPSPVPDGAFFQVFEACLHLQGIKAPCAASLTLLDDGGIRAINRDFRQTDRTTDVLSFPSLSLSPDALFDPGAAHSLEAWDSDAGAFFLGDLFLNTAQAYRQAAEYAHSVFRETLYLFAHGVFHLIGYDHDSMAHQEMMREREESALDNAFQKDKQDAALLDAARAARAFAHTPYSKYSVGAALLGKDGRVYTGCNVENASFGLTNCAERTAVFKAVSEGQKEFEAIAIAADQTPPWPCGACRQVLSEFAPDLRVLITWGEGKVAHSTLDRLLPHSFLSFEEDGHAGQ